MIKNDKKYAMISFNTIQNLVLFILEKSDEHLSVKTMHSYFASDNEMSITSFFNMTILPIVKQGKIKLIDYKKSYTGDRTLAKVSLQLETEEEMKNLTQRYIDHQTALDGREW